MKILLLEPFLGGSHQQWAEGYQQHSQHDVSIIGLKGRHWKWRMYGGAVSLARKLDEVKELPDLILASDMLDVATFRGLINTTWRKIPLATYFHENQITYPWSPTDQDLKLKRNNQYGFINYTSALASDMIYFNSSFHKMAFLEALPSFLKQFPDARELDTVAEIADKSDVLPLGMDLQSLNSSPPKKKNEIPIILWNHRWEYDKNPESFFQLLFRLKAAKHRFKVIVLGASYQQYPSIFDDARTLLKDEILHWGYAPSKSEYARLLWIADILLTTSKQDFFGGSVVEAIYCNCYPLLPHRLAYPMHIPEAKRATHLYHSDEEVYKMLESYISSFSMLNQVESYQHFVAQYDWSILAAEYDLTFEQLIKHHGK